MELWSKQSKIEFTNQPLNGRNLCRLLNGGRPVKSGIKKLTELYTDILAEQAKKQISEQYASPKQRDEVMRNLIDYVGRKEK